MKLALRSNVGGAIAMMIGAHPSRVRHLRSGRIGTGGDLLRLAPRRRYRVFVRFPLLALSIDFEGPGGRHRDRQCRYLHGQHQYQRQERDGCRADHAPGSEFRGDLHRSGERPGRMPGRQHRKPVIPENLILRFSSSDFWILEGLQVRDLRCRGASVSNPSNNGRVSFVHFTCSSNNISLAFEFCF